MVSFILALFFVLCQYAAPPSIFPNSNDIFDASLYQALTEKEKDWLKRNQIIKVAGPKAFPPFHFYEPSGDLKGMAAEYIHLIAGKLGLQLDIKANLPWPEVIKRAKQKEIDLISCAAKTSERENYLSFSNPYLSFPMVIFTRKDFTFIGGLEDLHYKKVAVISKVATYDWLKRDQIEIHPHLVKTPLDALKAVSIGTADAYIGNLAASSYMIDKNGLVNLKVAAPTPYGNYKLYFAARDDWPVLTSILNKALDHISPEQHANIRNQCLSIRY